MTYDLIIVGAGPAGIFTALEILRRGSREKILLVEKGRPVQQRRCPKAQTGRCILFDSVKVTEYNGLSG